MKAYCIRFICAVALFCVFAVFARELPSYRLGDVAEDDVTTPVAFDVTNADAAVAHAAAALEIPALRSMRP